MRKLENIVKIASKRNPAARSRAFQEIQTSCGPDMFLLRVVSDRKCVLCGMIFGTWVEYCTMEIMSNYSFVSNMFGTSFELVRALKMCMINTIFSGI